MKRAATWAKSLIKAWAASWLFLIWNVIIFVAGVTVGMMAADTAFRAMLQSKGLLP